MAAAAAIPQPVRSNCTTGFINVRGNQVWGIHHAGEVS